MIENIGDILKKIRKNKKITLQQVADKSTLSVAYLSKLERNLSSPTLIQLHKICEALEVTFSEVIKSKDNKKNDLFQKVSVMKKNQRKELLSLDEGVIYETLTFGNNTLEGLSITIPTGKKIDELSWGHYSDELGVIIEGELIIQIENKQFVLEQGDSIYIHSHTPHRLISKGKASISHWCYINGNGK